MSRPQYPTAAGVGKPRRRGDFARLASKPGAGALTGLITAAVAVLATHL